MPRFSLILVVLAAACGSPQYAVSTCSFAGRSEGCELTVPLDSASTAVVYHFTLVNPRQPMAACSGEVSLELRDGKAHFHAEEKDPATCARVGDEVEGSADVRGELVQDVYFPAQDYTFRFSVKEQ